MQSFCLLLTRDYYRPLMQDLGVVLDSLLRALLGPLYVFYQLVQHVHEDLLHFLNCVYYISDAL